MAKLWHIWSEGYAATGEHSTAQYHGQWLGDTFIDACRAWSLTTSSPNSFAISKSGIPSYWACRLFDNEMDARKSFG